MFRCPGGNRGGEIERGWMNSMAVRWGMGWDADCSNSAGLPKHVRGFVEAGIFTGPWESRDSWPCTRSPPVLLLADYVCACAGNVLCECEWVDVKWISVCAYMYMLWSLRACVCVWQARLSKEQRWGSALLSRHQSLEEEFERAKAAVEVSRVLFSTPHICHLSAVSCVHRWLLMRFNMEDRVGFFFFNIK